MTESTRAMTGVAVPEPDTPSFSRALVLNVVGIVVLISGILLLVLVMQSVESTEKASRSVAQETAARVAERLQILIQAMELTAESAERAAHTHSLSSSTLRTTLEYSQGAFEQRPELSYLGFSLPDTGQYGGLERDSAGDLFLWLFPPPDGGVATVSRSKLAADGFKPFETLSTAAYDPRKSRFYNALLDSQSDEVWVSANPWLPPFAPATGLWGIAYARALKNDNDTLLGVISIEIDLPAINAFVKTLSAEYNTQIEVIELGTEARLIAGNGVAQAPLPVPDALRPLLDNRDGPFADRMTLEGEQRRIAAHRVSLKGGLSWMVVTSRPAPLIEAPLRAQLYQIAGMILALILGLVAITLRMARRFGDPVSYLERRVVNINWRDIDFPADARHSTADEFRETQLLSDALDRMEVAVKQMLESQEQREASLALKGAIFDSSRIAIFSLDHQRAVIEWNGAAADLFGLAREEVLGHRVEELIQVPDNNTDWVSLLQSSLASACRFNGAQGVFDAELRVASFKRDGLEVHTVFLEDVSERKRAEQRIRYLATFDGLTGLPNRELIQDRIAQAIARARRTNRYVALLYLDLDRFKVLNDGFGHSFGDIVLKAIAERLQSLVREVDTVSRQGGDEFLILLVDLESADNAYGVARKIVQNLDQPLQVGARTVHLSGSIGVSVFPQDGDTAEALIESADVAMYRAKDMGRNNCQFFTREMSEETLQRVNIETQLRSAIAAEQLTLVYQPKVSLRSGKVTGCEALLRWQHPDLGVVPPSQFIPIAESSGLIVPIGEWVLRTACTQAKKWLDTGLPPVSVAVNISARQFIKVDLVETVMQALHETDLPATFLELELTESLMAQDVDRVIATVNTLSESGVKFSIDDFGIGYSSLSYLKRYRVDTLKIDGSFVRDMLLDPDDATIVLSVIALAHNLGYQVIAEGVETQAQYDYLQRNNCDEIQGYYASKPLSAEAFEVMLTESMVATQSDR